MDIRQIIMTEDGSHSLFIQGSNISYHSMHGAIRESKHIFIQEGLEYFYERIKTNKSTINIFEVGFGTGLNALLTLQFALEKQQDILYETVEPFPLSTEEFQQLNYTSLINEKLSDSYKKMHQCKWDVSIFIHELFSFKKIQGYLQDFNTDQQFHIIYFDAFDPVAQPGLWSENIFQKMYDLLFPGGILVTYSSKGLVRRAMQSAGFIVEKLKGPPGKREIVRAEKRFSV